MTQSERYKAAVTRVSVAVARLFGTVPGQDPMAKRTRIGLAMTASDHTGLVKLLIDKGVITQDEYSAAIDDAAETTAKEYEHA